MAIQLEYNEAIISGLKRVLIEQCKELDPQFDTLYEKEADSLTIYGVEIRYPDDFYMPTREETESSIQIALFTYEFVRAQLP